MNVRFPKMNIRLLFCLAPLSIQSVAYAAAADCFPSVEAYASKSYGAEFRDDENIVLSKKKFGKAMFDVVEDKTSGTNHPRSLLSKRAGGYCVVLTTLAVAQLAPIATNDSGVPLKFRSSDQAPPGLPQHEITYTLDPTSSVYEPGDCREISYVGKKKNAKPVECKSMFE